MARLMLDRRRNSTDLPFPWDLPRWPLLLGVLLVLAVPLAALAAQQSRFATTGSRSQYVHWINLYDAKGRLIKPGDPNSPPYSPKATCGRCHDYEAIAEGYHFNAPQAAAAGRAGEPWVWTDQRTGTQLPLSYRGWSGTYRPQDVGLTARQFVLQFGRHLPGGGPGAGELPAEPGQQPDATAGRWRLSGALEIDCMICHSGDRAYSPERRADQIAEENLAWAATAALRLAEVTGSVRRLKDDFDPEAAAGSTTGPRLPATRYRAERFDSANKVFFDILRRPLNDACYYCHTSRRVDPEAPPTWIHDEDVHIKAGLLCVDCHRNGIGHHTVRGYEGEVHPTGQSVASLGCRGCHLGEGEGAAEVQMAGRFGAPKPLHKGLPPIHLEKLSCTACHAGPVPRSTALQIETSLAHQLGLPEHRDELLPPGIVAPVILPDEQGVLHPYRLVWPAFWGVIEGEQVKPLNPEEVYGQLRRVLRVRRNFAEELARVRLSREDKIAALGQERASVPQSELTTDELAKLEELTKEKAREQVRQKVIDALKALADGGAEGQPVYVSGGKLYRLGQDDQLEVVEHPAAQPYRWPLAHDVRPARQSLGASGCFECHRDGAPIFYGTVAALGQLPDDAPPTQVLYELQGFDPDLLAAWNQSFQGRTAFKWTGVASVAALVIIVLLAAVLAGSGVLRLLRGE